MCFMIYKQTHCGDRSGYDVVGTGKGPAHEWTISYSAQDGTNSKGNIITK